jgi:hypothetical protein
LIVAIAKIGFFNLWRGNQSDLAVRSSLRLVGFWGLTMDFAMTGDVKGFGRLRTKASSAGTRGRHALVYG